MKDLTQDKQSTWGCSCVFGLWWGESQDMKEVSEEVVSRLLPRTVENTTLFESVLADGPLHILMPLQSIRMEQDSLSRE
jgi:hypothetical protein